jgi:hypothetical protein
MGNPKLENFGQEKLITSAGRAHDTVTTPEREASTARPAPALLIPIIWARVKEYLWRSGIFPPQSELAVHEVAGDAILISCSWLLQDDAEEPDRRATTVRIVIHGDLVDLFHNANPETLKQLNEALVREVARRMNWYQADCRLPYHRRPPFEIRVGLGLMGWIGLRGSP